MVSQGNMISVYCPMHPQGDCYVIFCPYGQAEHHREMQKRYPQQYAQTRVNLETEQTKQKRKEEQEMLLLLT